jgi:hypothetical protein
MLEMRPREAQSERAGGSTATRIASGSRNAELTRLAGTMRRRGAAEASIAAALTAENRERCDPPLDDAEVRRIARSVARYEPEPDNSGNALPRGALLSLATVCPEPVAWLWPGRIPRGMLTVLDGDPGLGKSALTLDLAARVSRGLPMPDGSPGASGAVVLVSLEDSLAHTIRPRLDAAGGDAAKVQAFTVRDSHGERVPTLPNDIPELERLVAECGALLVIVDPLMAALSGAVNAHHDQDVRRVLAPLSKLAERSGAAVLVVRHLNKSAGANPLYRGGGSIGITGAARSLLLLARDPDDPERRVLAHTKCNVSAHAPSLALRVAEATNRAPRIEWLGESGHSGVSLLAAPADGDESTSQAEAEDFLRGELAGGEREAREVLSQARRQGIPERTLARARRSLGIKPRRRGFGPGATYWWALVPTHAHHARHASGDGDHGVHGEHGTAEPPEWGAGPGPLPGDAPDAGAGP